MWMIPASVNGGSHGERRHGRARGTIAVDVVCIMAFGESPRPLQTPRSGDKIQIFEIDSWTCSRSHPGVEVAPQIPTLSPSENHSCFSSEGSEIWYVCGFLDLQRSKSTFPLELDEPDTKMTTSCLRANSASSSCRVATCEQIVW